jgi:hypothetical protein
MPSINYVLAYCRICFKQYKVSPERSTRQMTVAGETVSVSRLAEINCTEKGCKGTLARIPEYGEPVSPWVPQGFWPMSPDDVWMA